MSNRWFLTAAVILGFTTLQAQTSNQDNACQRLNRAEQFMKDSLRLTATQQAQIKILHDSACLRMRQAHEEAKGDKEAMKTSKRAIMTELKADYKEILTRDQLAKWKEHREANSKKSKHSAQ